MDAATADKIYDILVEECGATERNREYFVSSQDGRDDDEIPEWRFQGELGFGGKFWRNAGRWYVNGYPEDATPDRTAAIERANTRLAQLRSLVEA